jgi:hypothetical protein
VNAAKPLLYLMRTDFGVRANTPAMIIGVTCLFACYHEPATAVLPELRVAFHPYMRSGGLHSDGALVVALAFGA